MKIMRFVLALSMVALGGLASAQVIPSKNVNIVNFDPFHQKQLEVDAAANPLNPNHIFAGYINYQTVDEDPNSVTSVGLCGFSFSTNGGKTWRNGFVDPVPLTGKCGDPVVAWDTSGHAFYFALTELTDGVTTLMVVWRFTDPNDGTGAIIPDGPGRVIDNGTGNFGAQLDKNSVIFQPDATPGGDPEAPGTLFFCYSSFQGNASNNIKVLCSISRDGGDTYSLPNQGKYNGNINSNNGTAAAPGRDGSIYLFWRAFSSSENGYYFVKVRPDGTATQPVQVVGGSQFHPYDAPTLLDLARTLAFPSVASNGDQEILLVFQAYSDGFGMMTESSPFASPRIFGVFSDDGGVSWSFPFVIDGGPHMNTHQFLPSAAYAGGVWSVMFNDARNDGCFGQEVLGCPGRPLDPNPVSVFGEPRHFPRGRDRRFDVRVAQGVLDASDELNFSPSTQVTQYETSANPDTRGQIVQRDPTCGVACGPALNFPFLPVGAGGNAAWMGDYNAHTAKVSLLRNTDPSGTPWRYTGPGDPTTTLAFWADFRGVYFPSGNINGNWTLFNPLPVNVCANPNSRDVDVLFSEITNGDLSASVKSTALRPGTPPEFTVNVQNLSGRDVFLRLEIADGASAVPPAADEDWSMVQTPPPPDAVPLDDNDVDVKILTNSSVTKTVYYRFRTDSTPVAPVVVKIFETTGVVLEGSDCVEGVCVPGGSRVEGGLETSVTYGISTTSPAGGPVHAVDVSSPVVTAFSRTEQPSNKLIENKLIENKLIENKLIENKLIENKLIENSLVEDQQVLWTVTGDGALTTASTAFSSVANGQELLDDGWIFQLLLYQTQLNPQVFQVAGQDQCVQLPIETDVVLSNIAITNKLIENKLIENFQVSNKLIENKLIENKLIENSPISEQVSNAAFSVDSGEEVHIALRAFKPPGSLLTFDPDVDENAQIGEAVFGQANNPDGTSVGAFFDTTPPVITPIVTGTLGENGWHRSDVTVSWTVTDAQSGIVSTDGCDTVRLTDETSGTTLTCSATNRADLFSSESVTVKIDKTPPNPPTASVSPEPNAAGWNKDPEVTVTFSSAGDAGAVQSGVASCTMPSFVSGETLGANVIGTCTDVAGNTSAPTVVIVKIDTTAPTVEITQPADGMSYLLNSSSVPALYSCVDLLSDIDSCTGPVSSGSNFDTSTVGSNAFTVTATDLAENTAAQTNNYFVVYDFVLKPPKSPSKLGNAVPLTWQLKDANGASISDLSSLITLTSHFTDGVLPENGVCPITFPGATEVVQLYAPATGAEGGSDFRLLRSKSSYRFNWDTKTLSTGPGCYTLVWQFDDNAGPAAGFDVLDESLLQMEAVELK